MENIVINLAQTATYAAVPETNRGMCGTIDASRIEDERSSSDGHDNARLDAAQHRQRAKSSRDTIRLAVAAAGILSLAGTSQTVPLAVADMLQ